MFLVIFIILVILVILGISWFYIVIASIKKGENSKLNEKKKLGKNKKQNIYDLSENIEEKENDEYYYKKEDMSDDISQKEIHKHDGWNNNENPIKYR